MRGVIVNKTFTTPLSHSLGVDGIYKLEVHDEKNLVHHQMVPRDVFLAYELGDKFAPDSVPATVRGKSATTGCPGSEGKARRCATRGTRDAARSGI